MVPKLDRLARSVPDAREIGDRPPAASGYPSAARGMDTAAKWRHNELLCRSRSAKGADHCMHARERPHAEAGHPAALVTERLHLLRAYRHAWDGRTAEEISPWLERCWRATSSYVNPILDSVRGPQGLTQVILEYELLFPDLVIRPTGGVAIHHDLASYRWCLSSSAPIRLLDHDFGSMITGYDVVEFDDVGITRVMGFFDGLAQHPAWDQPPSHRKG